MWALREWKGVITMIAQALEQRRVQRTGLNARQTAAAAQSQLMQMQAELRRTAPQRAADGNAAAMAAVLDSTRQQLEQASGAGAGTCTCVCCLVTWRTRVATRALTMSPLRDAHTLVMPWPHTQVQLLRLP